jgi:hypothetical protein
MTLVSTIIQDAYRESNLIAVTAAPTADQSAEALRLLNRMISSLYGDEAGNQLNPMPIGRNNISRPSGYPYYENTPDGNWFVPLNTQLVLNTTEATEVWLHPQPQDGSRFAFIDQSANLATYPLTVHGNGRSIGGSVTQVFNTNSQVAEYMFRVDVGNWFKVTDLDYTDDMPFPIDFDDLFTIGLAIRLNPRYQQQIDTQTISTYKDILRQFQARYRQVIQMPSEWGLVMLPGTRWDRYWFYGNSTSAFNSGLGLPYPNIW